MTRVMDKYAGNHEEQEQEKVRKEKEIIRVSVRWTESIYI